MKGAVYRREMLSGVGFITAVGGASKAGRGEDSSSGSSGRLEKAGIAIELQDAEISRESAKANVRLVGKLINETGGKLYAPSVDIDLYAPFEIGPITVFTADIFSGIERLETLEPGESANAEFEFEAGPSDGAMISLNDSTVNFDVMVEHVDGSVEMSGARHVDIPMM